MTLIKNDEMLGYIEIDDVSPLVMQDQHDAIYRVDRQS